MSRKQSFTGFSKNTIDFLNNLKRNNNKDWFEENKQVYNRYLLEPLRGLVADLSYFMLEIDPLFEVTPAVNKTISRIYRDIRFSKDKSLFKTNMWITFKRPQKDWKDAPAYFFEISPDSYRFGMGFYSATPSTMKKFRELIDERPKKFQQAISFYSKQKTFVLKGEKYKRVFNEAKSKEIQDWYQRKNFYLVCNRKIDTALFSEKLVNDLISGFGSLADFYHFLLQVK